MSIFAYLAQFNMEDREPRTHALARRMIFCALVHHEPLVVSASLDSHVPLPHGTRSTISPCFLS